LVFEVPNEELELVKNLARATMEEAMSLSVPLKVEMKVGTNWYEVEPVN
jgi:DNA polymerase-1